MKWFNTLIFDIPLKSIKYYAHMQNTSCLLKTKQAQSILNLFLFFYFSRELHKLICSASLLYSLHSIGGSNKVCSFNHSYKKSSVYSFQLFFSVRNIHNSEQINAQSLISFIFSHYSCFTHQKQRLQLSTLNGETERQD